MPYPAETAAPRPSIFGRIRSRLGIGRDDAASLEKGLKLHEAGDLDGAIALLEPAFSHPDGPGPIGDNLLFQTGRLLLAEWQIEAGLRDGKTELVRAGLRVLITLPRGNVNDLRNGDIPWLEKLARAEELLTQALTQTNPHRFEASAFLPEATTLASAFNLLTEHDSARRTCRTLLTRSSAESPALHLVLAEAEVGLGHPQEALDSLSRAIRTGIAPESDGFALALLGSLHRAGDRDIADHAEILTGELHCLQGRANQGLPILQRAIERQGDRAELGPIRSLMGLYAKTRRFSEYEDTLNLLLRRDLPDIVRVRLTREVQEMAERSPDRPRLRGALAILEHRAGEATRAINELVTLLATQPDLALDYNRLLQAVPSPPPAEPLPEPTQTLWFIRALLDGGALEAAVRLLHGLDLSALDPLQAADARRLADTVASHLPGIALPPGLIGPTPPAAEAEVTSPTPPPATTTLSGPPPPPLPLAAPTLDPAHATAATDPTPNPPTTPHPPLPAPSLPESPAGTLVSLPPQPAPDRHLADLESWLAELARSCPSLHACALLSAHGRLLACHAPSATDERSRTQSNATLLAVSHMGMALLRLLEATPVLSHPHDPNPSHRSPPTPPPTPPPRHLEIQSQSGRATLMEAGPNTYLVLWSNGQTQPGTELARAQEFTRATRPHPAGAEFPSTP